MKIDFSDFEVRNCTLEDLNDILSLQEEVFQTISSVEILRKNSVDMLKSCLQKPNYTVGAWYKGIFAGFAILYFPQNLFENLAVSLEGVNFEDLKVANFKLVIVSKYFVGNSLQFHFGKHLEEVAKKQKTKLLCATVSPLNQFSINNMERLGYTYNRTFSKYGYARNLYYKRLE